MDLMIVIGGEKNRKKQKLAKNCASRLPAFHVAEPGCFRSARQIAHRPVGQSDEVIAEDWLPAGQVSIGLTSGASTPDNIVEQVIGRIAGLANS